MIPGVPLTEVEIDGEPIKDWERTEVVGTDSDQKVAGVAVFYTPNETRPDEPTDRGFDYCAVRVETIVQKGFEENNVGVFEDKNTRVIILCHGRVDWEGVSRIHFGHHQNDDAPGGNTAGYLTGTALSDICTANELIEELKHEYCSYGQEINKNQ